MDTTCCIVGGGPAGVMLALLLARRGIDVTLLEMHRDFDRDFRGDTVHPSTLEVLDQIGLASALHELPHAKMRRVALHTQDRTINVVDFARLKTKFRYVMIMPQVDFLDFLRAQAERYPTFHCLMGARVHELLRDGERVTGVVYRRDGEDHHLRARLTVACDGRFSRMRGLAGREAQRQSPPMDVAWFRLPRDPTDGYEEGGFFVGMGRFLVMLTRPDDWQIGYVFPKGDFAQVKAEGIEAFRRSIAGLVGWLGDRVEQIDEWKSVHLLPVAADRISQWHSPGLLFLGDAAHVMSPVGGVGINAAISDAVETANVIGAGRFDGLDEVQKRRGRATIVIQRMQSAIQQQVVARALSSQGFDLPWVAKLILRTPGLRTIPARIFALGPRRVRLEP